MSIDVDHKTKAAFVTGPLKQLLQALDGRIVEVEYNTTKLIYDEEGRIEERVMVYYKDSMWHMEINITSDTLCELTEWALKAVKEVSQCVLPYKQAY